MNVDHKVNFPLWWRFKKVFDFNSESDYYYFYRKFIVAGRDTSLSIKSSVSIGECYKFKFHIPIYFSGNKINIDLTNFKNVSIEIEFYEDAVDNEIDITVIDLEEVTLNWHRRNYSEVNKIIVNGQRKL